MERALISVSDKTGVVELAAALHPLPVEILSTGGTARLLQEHGIPVVPLSTYIGFPEILNGRVKSLHPLIFGGLLGRRGEGEHRQQMATHGIKPIDLLVVNLYPFEEVTTAPDCSLQEALEQIDIGGPSLLRAAAKNFEDVVVLVDPEDYNSFLKELQDGRGVISRTTRLRLATKVFAHTACYDRLIARYLARQGGEDEGLFPARLELELEKLQDLRYGENPHQRAAWYRQANSQATGLTRLLQLQGKALSFTNLMDLDAALGIAREFDECAAVIIKHNNPCGAAVAPSPHEAYVKARETDPLSAFGGVVGFNRLVDAATAQAITSTFIEVVVAPGYAPDVLPLFASKPNLRVLALPGFLEQVPPGGDLDLRCISGGILVQEADRLSLHQLHLQVVTNRAPNPQEWRALRFAWKVIKHVKSNAIVLTTEEQTVGIGAGQMSRVDACRLAVIKANLPTRGTVLASDAFFPFSDGLEVAAEAGVTAVIQPGGSVRDQEVVATANRFNLAMVFTGSRHFRH